MKLSELKSLIINEIESSEHNVFFRKDFLELGGTCDQVGVVVKEMCEEQKLRRVGHGIYGKTKTLNTEPYVGKVVLVKGLTEIAPEALTRLGYRLGVPKAVLDYNNRVSTQVPTGRRVCIQGKKTKRKIGYNGMYVSYEYIN
jgi:hypothetical protein